MAKKRIVMEEPERVETRAIRRHEVRKQYEIMNAKQRAYSDEQFALRQSPFSEYYYGGQDPRRKRENADAGMVAEDQNAVSNLSPRGYQMEYPAANYFKSPYVLGGDVREPNIVYEEDGSFIRGKRRKDG